MKFSALIGLVLACGVAAAPCSVGDMVMCSSGEACMGNQCCSDGFTCSSADNSVSVQCPKQKEYDCTTGGGMNIVETAQAVPELSSLVAALSTAGLVETLAGDGPFTVFAPTNDAFDAISSVVAGLIPEALIDLLTYHVVGAEAFAKDLSNGQVLATVFATHSLTVDLSVAGTVTITTESGNSAQVTMADVVCSNGVVHIVDAVLIPNGLPAASALMTMVETAVATPSLSTLVSALTTAGLAETLEGAGPFTVFAPTNDAFDAISPIVAGLSPEALIDLLTYHVVGAEAFAKDLSNGEVLATVFATHSLTVDLSVAGTVTITTESGYSAQVKMADVACSNGVVHIVDAVLIPNGLPPSVLALLV